MKTKPRVLLLGDSIRGGYEPEVRAALESIATVVAPAENCQYSAYTLENLDRWLSELGTPDIIHWNNGLHDVGHNPPREPVQFPLDVYISNLEKIIARLSQTNAHIIFATTTPVHPKMVFRNTHWSWRNEEIDAYNAAAVELMEKHGIPINDLHKVIAADPERYISDDYLHLTEEGQSLCAQAVAETIKQYVSK